MNNAFNSFINVKIFFNFAGFYLLLGWKLTKIRIATSLNFSKMAKEQPQIIGC